MATIGTQSLSQLVKVNGQASGFGDFRKAVFDADNIEALKNSFYPLSPQVDALRSAAEVGMSGGSILFMGAEGTGKTSLMLMLGKLLSLPFPSDTLSSLSSNISDVAVVRSLLALRTNGRRWLVVTPEFGANEDFDSAVRRALNGALFVQGAEDFVPQSGSLTEEFSETAKHLHQTGNFDGIAVLADGFDAIFDQVVSATPGANGEQVTAFAEFCVKCRFPVMFVGTVDRDMSHFGIAEETKMLESFGRVQPVSLLGKVGEWEELVGKVVMSHPQDEAWQTVVGYKDFRAVAESTARSGLYQGASDRWLNDVIMQGAYPLHPSALFALPRVALHLAAKGKTAFSFFSDAAPGGLTYFLRNFAVVQPNGRLHLYTADSLYTYFEKVIQNDPANKEYVEALQKAVMVAGDIPQSRRILRMVLIFQMVGFDRLRTRAEDLIWALHIDERATRIAKHSLELLVQKKALSYVEATGEYLLPVERKKVTFEEALQRVSNRVRSQVNVRGELQKALKYGRIEAKGLNARYGGDRCAFSKAFVVNDFRDVSVFLSSVADSTEQLRPYRGDLMVAFVVPETAEELESIKGDLEAGKLNSKRLIVALPKVPSAFSKAVLHKFALQRLLLSEQPFSDPSTDEYTQANTALQEATAELSASVERALSVKELVFYYEGQGVSDLDEAGLQELVEGKIAALVGTPPAMSEPSLGFLRDAGHMRRRRQIAINYLLSCQGRLALREDSWDISQVLQAGLVDTGVLSLCADRGVWRSYDMSESIPSDGVGGAYHFLQEKIIGGAGEERTICARDVVLPLLETPYSLTPATIELLLAVLAWKWPEAVTLRRNFRRAEAESNNSMLESVAVSAESLFDLVGNSADWALCFCDAEPHAARFLKGVLDLAGSEHAVAGDSLWSNAGESLKASYQALPAAARVANAVAQQCDDEAQASLAENVRVFVSDNLTRDDYRKLFQVTLPAALKMEKDFSFAEQGEAMLEQLAQGMNSLRQVVSQREELLCTGLREIMAAHISGKTEESWVKRSAEWLAANQAGVEVGIWKREWNALSEASEATDDERQALRTFVVALGYGDIDEWTSDFSADILERVRTMREELEWRLYCKGYVVSSKVEGCRRVLSPVIARAGFSETELQKFLELELSWIAWPDYVRVQMGLTTEQEADDVGRASRQFLDNADDWLVSEDDSAEGSEDLEAVEETDGESKPSRGDALVEENTEAADKLVAGADREGEATEASAEVESQPSAPAAKAETTETMAEATETAAETTETATETAETKEAAAETATATTPAEASESVAERSADSPPETSNKLTLDSSEKEECPSILSVLGGSDSARAEDAPESVVRSAANGDHVDDSNKYTAELDEPTLQWL